MNLEKRTEELERRSKRLNQANRVDDLSDVDITEEVRHLCICDFYEKHGRNPTEDELDTLMRK